MTAPATFNTRRETADHLIDQAIKRALRAERAGLRHSFHIELLVAAHTAARVLRTQPPESFSAAFTHQTGVPLHIERTPQ